MQHFLHGRTPPTHQVFHVTFVRVVGDVIDGMEWCHGPHSRAAQAERTVGALRFFLYIRFFLNAPLDLLLDPLTLSGSLVLHFTVVGTSESLLCFQPATLHF
jgi:hypothetical protein